MKKAVLFSTSLHDEFNNRLGQIRSRISALKDHELEGADIGNLTVAISDEFLFPAAADLKPELIERGEPEFKHGTDLVRIAVYIPFTGDSSSFLYSHRSRLLEQPAFEIRDTELVRVHELRQCLVGVLERDIATDVTNIENGLRQVREAFPLFNSDIRRTTEEAMQIRLKAFNKTKSASAALSQLKINVRKRGPSRILGTKWLICPHTP